MEANKESREESRKRIDELARPIFKETKSKINANNKYAMDEIERLAGVDVRLVCESQAYLSSTYTKLEAMTMVLAAAAGPTAIEDLRKPVEHLGDDFIEMQSASMKLILGRLISDPGVTVKVYNIMGELVTREKEMMVDAITGSIDKIVGSKKG